MGNPRGRPEKIESDERCPQCGSVMIKRGHMFIRKGEFQRYACKECGYFTIHPISNSVLQKIDTSISKKVD